MREARFLVLCEKATFSCTMQKARFLVWAASRNDPSFSTALLAGFCTIKANPVFGFLFSDPIIVALRPTMMGLESETGFFGTFRRLFLPGTLKNVPCYLVNFREEFRRLGFQRMANWRVFDKKILFRTILPAPFFF